MSTLKEILHSINESENWSYYYHNPSIPETVLYSGEEALAFIKRYYNLAGKEEVFSFPEIQCTRGNKALEERASHIISTFLLGIKIAECMGIDISKRNESNMSFQYYWFLTCLYHDIGYIYEKDYNCEHLRMISSDGLEAVQAIYGITYLRESEFITYPEKLVDLYLRKRAACNSEKCDSINHLYHRQRATCQKERHGVIDHGIIGGLMLYDGLRKQFEASWKKRTDKKDTRKKFYTRIGERKLHCSNLHYEAYARAADAIIMHNIWKDTLKKYMKEESITTKIDDARISYTSKQLCFILCLADTIEPIKRNQEYAETVRFTFNHNQIIINSDKQVIDRVYKYFKKNESWLPISVDVSTDQVNITIKELRAENSQCRIRVRTSRIMHRVEEFFTRS